MTPFNLQPTLTGPTLKLRPLAEEDFEALFAVSSDPLLWEQHPEPTRYQRDVFSRLFRGAMDSKGAFAILDQATGEIIGSSRYYEYSPEKSSVAIGFTFLARKYWGGKTNRELKTLMLDHAFNSVETAIFHVGEHNLRSQLAMKKIGGELFDQFEKETPTQGKQITLCFRIRRSGN